jgi:hypothetical protein
VWWAAGAALGTGAWLLGARLVRGESLAPAARGLGGLVVAVAFAALSGNSAVRAGVQSGLYRAELTELLALPSSPWGGP